MATAIRADYNQCYMFPPRLEDWVPDNHPARFIRDFVDALDLEKLGFRVPSEEAGRRAYAPDLLLKVWLYGYFNKTRSSRAMEKGCHENMALIWLTGNHHPDHNTLWRFWRDNRPFIKKVFQQTVKLAMENNMVSLALQALDGTKIAAQVSTDKALHREDLRKYLGRLDKGIEEVMAQSETLQETESAGYALPPEMADVVRRREEIARALGEMNEADCNHMHERDKEARVMNVEGKQKLCYNAQAVTEEKNRIIVASEVTNEANDFHQLNPMIEQARENTGKTAAETVADSGYCCAEQLAEAERQKHGVLVHIRPAPEKGDKAFGKSRFTYDREQNCYICPQGERLEHVSTKDRDGHQITTYRCRNRACEYRDRCTKDTRGRSIERDAYEDALDRQKEKQQDARTQALLRKRKEIAEISFARIKWHMDFRRWLVRGVENVKAQWALLCATLNLKTLYSFWKEGKLKMA